MKKCGKKSRPTRNQGGLSFDSLSVNLDVILQFVESVEDLVAADVLTEGTNVLGRILLSQVKNNFIDWLDWKAGSGRAAITSQVHGAQKCFGGLKVDLVVL